MVGPHPRRIDGVRRGRRPIRLVHIRGPFGFHVFKMTFALVTDLIDGGEVFGPISLLNNFWKLNIVKL